MGLQPHFHYKSLLTRSHSTEYKLGAGLRSTNTDWKLGLSKGRHNTFKHYCTVSIIKNTRDLSFVGVFCFVLFWFAFLVSFCYFVGGCCCCCWVCVCVVSFFLPFFFSSFLFFPVHSISPHPFAGCFVTVPTCQTPPGLT